MTEKSILEQALLQVQTLEEAVKQNAKGILASTMKEELNELLKESEEEGQKDEEVSEGDVPPMKDVEESDEPKEEEKDMSEQPEDESDDEESEDEDEDDEENIDDLDNEDPMKGIDSIDSEGGEDALNPSDDMGVDDMPSDDMGTDDMPSDDDVMDMTGASDDEVLKVFKAMKPEDGIVVKKDGDDIEMDLDGEEYIIKLDGEGESEIEEEPIYEIELDEEDSNVEASEGDEPKEVEASEAARTFANDVRKPANQGKKYKSGRKEINEEVETLKKQNAEYKKALVLFKEKLNEVAVFNANLAYATRLFTEHSTTKQEKLNILKRFDSVSTMNEAKTLFNSIKSELGTKKPVTESVVDKISTTPQTSSSQEVLSESKAYENPQFKRMKDLMSKIK